MLFADWEFRVSDGGRLMLFGADAEREPAGLDVARAAVAPVAAVAAATQGIDFTPGVDRARALPTAYWMPAAASSATDGSAGANATDESPGAGRVVRVVEIDTARPPFTSWLAFVDASTGEVVARLDRTHAVTGRVTALVHAGLPTDPMTARALAHLVVRTDTDSAETDANGDYTLPLAGATELRFALKGAFASVGRYDVQPVGDGDARDSTLAVDGATVDVAWGDDGLSHDAERDAYVAVQQAHDTLKSLDPGFTGLDLPVPVYVNVPFNHCNSVFAVGSIYCFNAGDGCVNTATMHDVLFHEYGHAINDGIYMAEGAPFGMLNGALHEGMADVNAAFDEDDPVVGEGFFGPGTFLRDLDNTSRWPDDIIGEVHTDGTIIGGAFWSLREAIGHPAAARLALQARHGRPDDADDGVAFHEMFDEVLVADDDDGDLSNGTPNIAAIAAAFGVHGIGPDFTIAIDPTPVADAPAGDAIAVTARITYTGPAYSALDAASPTVHVAIDRGPFTPVTMTPTGAADTFGATLSARPGSVVSYYITARDRYGSEARLPIGAPAARLERFVVGPATTVRFWDMETDPGWTVGAPDDAATTGIWVRARPIASFSPDPTTIVQVQPGEDHTPDGILCWVTANADTSLYPSTYADVDGGKTTLTSSVFDPLAGGVEHPVIEYWRWYSNNTGTFVGGDVWRVDLSGDDGVTWRPIEDTPASANTWQRILFRIEDYVPPTHTMRLRFVANDDDPPSIVEAAVDDVRLLAFAPGVVPPAAPAFASARPNPFGAQATLSLVLPDAGPVRLAVYDVTGRRVRQLADGVFPAGTHAFTWDGRDENGRSLPSGLYFARIEALGAHAVQKLLRAR